MSPGSARGSFTVGATNGFERLESYSSRGPTGDGRIKPDIVAPDAVTTVTFGPFGFPGTSASVPYVAGAAALVLSAYPDYGLDDVQEFLEARALRIEQQSKNNLVGSGRLQLGSAPDVTPVATPTSVPTPLPTATPEPTATPTGTRTPEPAGTQTSEPTATPDTHADGNGYPPHPHRDFMALKLSIPARYLASKQPLTPLPLLLLF